MELSLYNSLTRQTEPFIPQDPARVTMYACGPTVYSYVHIGNARPAVVFGVLADLLRRRCGHLVYARNITDVDDKINNAAKELGVPISAITDKYAAAYREDMAKLGVAPPDVEPHATTHIPQIVAMIERLIESGHAYAAEGHVLFSVATFPEYGRLSRRDPEEMLAGARVEVAPYKRNPGDFVLWKPSTDDLPGWDSPWGRGRPGWHIECSAMAASHLGETIDIHAGGIDLQFPHHENEVAQSTCAHGGKVFARYWLHNGLLNMEGRKMSKSLGNVLQLHALLERHPPEALRYALLSAHYRQPLDWSEALIEQSVRTLDRLYGTLRDLGDVEVDADAIQVPEAVEAALCDDLNTPVALAEMARIAGEARNPVSRLSNVRSAAEVLVFELNRGEPSYQLLAVATALSKQALRESDVPEFERELDQRSFAAREALGRNQTPENPGESEERLTELLHALEQWSAAVPVVREVEKAIDALLATYPIGSVDRETGLVAASQLVHSALRLFDRARTKKAELLGAGEALGLLQQDPAVWFARGADTSDDARIQALVEERAAAKKARDFARADAIRDQLATEGVLLEDTPQGVRWVRKRA